MIRPPQTCAIWREKRKAADKGGLLDASDRRAAVVCDADGLRVVLVGLAGPQCSQPSGCFHLGRFKVSKILALYI